MNQHKTIALFAELKENWDSYGASVIDPKQILLAQRFVHALANVQPIPTRDGGVAFEVDFGDVTLICETVSARKIELSIINEAIPDVEFAVCGGS